MSATVTYSLLATHPAAPAGTGSVRPRRGIFGRIGHAVMLSNQRRAEREIARVFGQSTGLTDEIERRITEHLVHNPNFRL